MKNEGFLSTSHYTFFPHHLWSGEHLACPWRLLQKLLPSWREEGGEFILRLVLKNDLQFKIPLRPAWHVLGDSTLDRVDLKLE